MDDLNLGKAEDFATITSQMEHISQPLDSCEVEKIKKVGKCNMRKSLAWDAAFFTSAGVLDADELSCMIDGGDSISKSQVLPGIEEDIYRSTDSLSTLGSENLTLESLELDLFEDIRASIQKSSLKSSRDNSIRATSPLNEDLASKSVAKSSTGPKKEISRMQTAGKLTVQSSNSPKGIHKSVAGSRVPTPSLQKATRPNDRPIPGPSAALGRSSLRANQVQLENDKAKGTSSVAKLAPLPKGPKVSSLTGPRRTVLKPVITSKSSSSSTSSATNKKDPPNSNSSSDSSNSRRISTRSVNPTSTNSILKPPSILAMKKKGDNNGLSSSRSSKLSTSISPASSISDWSVASSSSTSSVNQCSNAPSLSNVRRSNDRGLERHENKMQRPNSEKTNAQRGPPLKPASAKPSGVKMPPLNSERLNAGLTQKGQANKSELAKPSGLRMPSPKIGFFDGVKAASNTPSGSSQSRSGIPSSPKVEKDVSTPTGVSSKAKSPKLQPARLANPVGNIKRDTQKSASPRPSKKVSNASTKVYDSPENVVTPLNLSPLSKKEKKEQEYLNTKETGVKELSVVNCEETEMISVVDVDKEISADLVTLKLVPLIGDICDCKGKMASGDKYNDVKISGKNSHSADLKSGADLDEQMSANLVNSKIVSEDGGLLFCDGIMELKEKNKDVSIVTETNRIADLKSDVDLDENMKVNLVNSEIVRENGDLYDCREEIASEEKSNDVKSITEDFGPFYLKGETTLQKESIANSVIVTFDPLNEESYYCNEKMAFEENNKDVISITEKISPVDLKNNLNLEIKTGANSADIEIVPADGENYICERKMLSEEKNSDVTSITRKISLKDVKEAMHMDFNLSANSEDVKIGPVDRENFDCGGNDAIFTTENIDLVDSKSELNLGVNMTANSGNMEMVICERKLACEKKTNVDKISQDVESEMNLEVKLTEYLYSQYLHLQRIEMNLKEKISANLANVKVAPMDEDIYEKEILCQGKTDDEKSETKRLLCERKLVCEEKTNDDKISQDVESEMNLEVKLAEYLYSQYLHFQRVEMNQEEKISANLANVKVAPTDEDIYEKEILCQGKTDDDKSEIKRLSNSWNSPYKSAEKENQECDLQKENDISSFSNHKNFGHTEELLSDSFKISQIYETRTPFTDKNFPNNAERVDFSTGIIAEEMEKMTLLISSEYPPADN